jgi:Fe-S-cluster containining protein
MSVDHLLAELVEAEVRVAGAAMLSSDPVAARTDANARHEALVDGTRRLLPEKAACARGCSFCCHFRVAAPAHEVLALAAWIRRHLPPERQREILRRAAHHGAALRRMSPGDRLRANLACPVLDEDGACGAYAARPSRCRSYHARDVEGCREAFEHPDRPGRPHTTIPELLTVAETLGNGFHEATVALGYDPDSYELASALAEALAGSAPAERYRRKGRAFLEALPLSVRRR